MIRACLRPSRVATGRGDWIRTSDLHTPSVMRYQAALRPDLAGASRQGYQSRQGAAGGRVARRRRKSKAGKWLGRLSWRFGRARALPGRCLVGSLVPVNRGWSEPAAGHHRLHRRQRHSCRHHHAGQGAGARLGAAGPEERLRRAAPERGMDRVRLGRGARLSRHAELVGHYPADDLVRADRRPASDARRICASPYYAEREIRLRPEEYRRLWAAIRADFALDRRGRPQRIDHPGYGPADAFYRATGKANMVQHLQRGSPTGCGLPE